MQNRKGRCCLCMIFVMYISILTCHSQGLLFYGNEKRINERSSYSVFQKENRPVFRHEFRISFDYLVKAYDSSGYILSLEDKEADKVYSFTYINKEKHHSVFSFNEEGKKTFCIFNRSRDNLEYQWIPISIVLNIPKNEAEISIGEEKQHITNLELNKKEFSPSIYFGKYGHILDMASFAIRNLSVSSGKKVRNFPLNESTGEEVHDDKGNVIGFVENPVWLINQSYYWKELFSASSPTPAGLNFDSNSQRILLFNQDSLSVFDLSAHALSTYSYTNKLPVHLLLGMNFFDKTGNELYVYELNNLPIGDTTVAALNLSTREWRGVGTDYRKTQLHHHSGFYNPGNKRYTVFGGYGSRRYSNAFITYDIQHDRWDTLTLSGDRIAPRYFSGMVASSDYKRIYLYGGMGNESGDQNVGRNYFYDLYLANMEQKTIRKLWTHDAPATNRAVARNMILSADEKYIYMLGYPEYLPQSHLQLYRLSVSGGTCEAVGDSIPLISEEIATNVNLFYNAVFEEFYCSIQEFEEAGQVTTRVYSLAAPPVSLAAVESYLPIQKDNAEWSNRIIFIIVLALLVLGLCVIRWRKRTAACKEEKETDKEAEDAALNMNVREPQELTADKEESLLMLDIFPVRKSAIFLFGSFTVIDRVGHDITYMFSPKLRTIFLYILLNSVSKEGVLSSDMNELFWADKSDDKKKNLKGVTINHLRKILQDMDGIELTYQRGYFRLALEDDAYCDYLHFISLMGDMKKNDFTDAGSSELFSILFRGKFLATVDTNLFDYYKQEIEGIISPFLSVQLKNLFAAGKYTSAIRLANMLFTVDPLSDTALVYIVCSLQKQKKTDEALKQYNLFAKEYKKMMGEEYPVTYDKICY